MYYPVTLVKIDILKMQLTHLLVCCGSVVTHLVRVRDGT